MIARISVWLILLIVLPELYGEWRRRKQRPRPALWKRGLRWLPALLLTGCTVLLSLGRDFIPADRTLLDVYLLVVGVWVVPRFLYVLCSALGHGWARWRGSRRNWGNLVGLAVALWALYVMVDGIFIGPRQLYVRHVDLVLDGLPPAFDGYRVALFSDAHVGSVPPALLERTVDSINAQHPDLIAFVGDLQNTNPTELYPYTRLLSRLTASDGVFSVLGNHDYSFYNRGTEPSINAANERETISRERQMGWTLLLNDHAAIGRAGDSIYVVGTENDGRPPFPQKADMQKAFQGVPQEAFVLMLQHDPSAWQRTILPQSAARLTLSGHTHGGQLSLLGWRPTMLTGHEDRGLYEAQGRWLYVTSGVGGLVPFRFNMPPEVVVLTLHAPASSGKSASLSHSSNNNCL